MVETEKCAGHSLSAWGLLPVNVNKWSFSSDKWELEDRSSLAGVAAQHTTSTPVRYQIRGSTEGRKQRKEQILRDLWSLISPTHWKQWKSSVWSHTLANHTIWHHLLLSFSFTRQFKHCPSTEHSKIWHRLLSQQHKGDDDHHRSFVLRSTTSSIYISKQKCQGKRKQRLHRWWWGWWWRVDAIYHHLILPEKASRKRKKRSISTNDDK